MAPSEAELIANYRILYDEFYRQHGGSGVQKPCFRLLTIHAGRSCDELKCDLRPADLQTAEYEALSYTWGSPLPDDEKVDPDSSDEWEDLSDSEAVSTMPMSNDDGEAPTANLPYISVNGHAVSVQSNLYNALRRVRAWDQDRALWADYCCINQNDNADRNEQVPRMDQIYSNAQRVIIWLGEADNETQQALSEIEALNTNAHLSGIYSVSGTASTRPQLAARLGCLANLLRRRWFDRMWIVQEAVLARQATVYVGQWSLSWTKFLTAAKTFASHLQCCAETIGSLTDSAGGDTDAIDDIRHNFVKISILDRATIENLSFHETLRVFHNRSCGDPRDRLYALLGVKASTERLVEPNYNVDVAELYKRASVKMIQRAKDLSIFMDVDNYAGDVEDLPWWCVDWTSIGIFGVQFWPLFRASGEYKTENIEQCTADTINLCGTIIDHVDQVISQDTRDNDRRTDLLLLQDSLARWEAAVQLPESGDDEYPTNGTRADAFWRTVLLGVRPGDTAGLADEDHSSYRRWRLWLDEYASLPRRHRETFHAEATADPTLRAYNNLLSNYPSTLRFFRTEDGYFGLGPETMEAGDDIVVLAGGNVPFVLRHVDSDCDNCDADQSRSQLIGWCYIHGFMHGEAVESITSGENRWRKFCLM